jgi:hypothetical protein
MAQSLPSYQLPERTTSGHSGPDYFKPLPPTPSTISVPTSPLIQVPAQQRRQRAASDSSWKPPADWINNTESPAGSPQLWTCYRPRSYSPLLPEPEPTSVTVWMESAPWRADPDSAQKTFWNVSAERPLPAVPEIPHRNPSRISLREHMSQKSSPRSTGRSDSSSQSDISLMEGLSKVIPGLPLEQAKQDSTSHLPSPLKSLRMLPTEEEQTTSTDFLDRSFEHASNDRKVARGHEAINRPQTGDTALIPQPLSWRKASSGSYFPESLCVCSQPSSSTTSGQREPRGKLRSWISRDSSGYSRQLEEKTQNYQNLSKTSTNSTQQGSSSGMTNNLLLTQVVQCGKDFWYHIRQTGSTSTEQNDHSSSFCPVHPNESSAAPTCEDQRSNVLLRLPGGFALVRQSTLSTSDTKTASSCSTLPKLQKPENDPYMVSETLTLEPPRMRTSWATHESEVTATSTRAIHNCSRISLGSIRSPESRSGSNVHLALPSPLTQEVLLPCDPPSQPQLLRSSSSSSAPNTRIRQRVDSVVEKSSPKPGLVSSTKSTWKSWRSR